MERGLDADFHTGQPELDLRRYFTNRSFRCLAYSSKLTLPSLFMSTSEKEGLSVVHSSEVTKPFLSLSNLSIDRLAKATILSSVCGFLEFDSGARSVPDTRRGYLLDLLATASQIARGLSPGNGWWFASIEFCQGGKIGARHPVQLSL